MIQIKAPDGFEACRCFIDGAREWKVYYRKFGEWYWKDLGYVGHSRIPDEELNKKAEELVIRAVTRGF